MKDEPIIDPKRDISEMLKRMEADHAKREDHENEERNAFVQLTEKAKTEKLTVEEIRFLMNFPLRER